MPAKRSTNLKRKLRYAARIGGEHHGKRLKKRTKAPSFAKLQSSSQNASRSKKANRAKNTLPELVLRRELQRHGLKCRQHVTDLPGKPEIVFDAEKVVVFCDGDFWPGRNWKARESRLMLGANADYWTAKIRYNILRDKAQTRILRKAGWQVLRLWETDIKRAPQTAAAVILKLLASRHSHALRPRAKRRGRRARS
jgi:DNA mismatch endonuclease (patch repair protein)